LLGRGECEGLETGAFAPHQHHRLHRPMVLDPTGLVVGAWAATVVGVAGTVAGAPGSVVAVPFGWPGAAPSALSTFCFQFGGGGILVPLGTKAIVIQPSFGTRSLPKLPLAAMPLETT